MPVMDGLEAIRKIRSMEGGKSPKIIAVTASALDENRAEMLGIGADDFLSKPFREVELFEKIHAQVGVEYLFADEPSAATGQEAPSPLTEEMLEGLPPALIESMREAVLRADLDLLLARIRGVEPYDPAAAAGLRRLAEGFEYEKLLALFGEGAAIESGAA
jgi:CheY-like chemotaxis protein